MPFAAKLLASFMVVSLIAWLVIAWAHLAPWLDRRTKRDALLVAVMPHMFRHVGAMAVMPGVTDAPPEWSVPLAYGDFATAVLALLSMIALRLSWRHATKLVWVFNVFGLLDMLHNAYNAAALRVAPSLGVVAYVVAFGVPGMFVFHVLVFRALLRRESPPPAA